jgi:hypothetical protein
MNWKGFGRKSSWPNFKVGYYPDSYLEELKKTMKNFSQDSRTPGRDMKPGPPGYEIGVLTTRPRRSV